MTVYRSSYGDALFGQDSFGLSGSITDGSAVITTSASVTVGAVNVISFSAADTASATASSAAQVIKDASSADTASATASANADRILSVSGSTSASASASASGLIVKDGSVTASLQNVVVGIAEKYAETDGYRTGYGLRTYGTQIYGENHSVEEASAQVNCSATVTANAIIVKDADVSDTSTATFTANGVIDVVGRVSDTISISVDITYNRVRLFSASESVSASVDVSARYKWLDADDPTTIWTDASDPSTTWQEADYLERAA